MDTHPLYSQYLRSYENSLSLWNIPFQHVSVPTTFGQTHIVEAGSPDQEPLVLLHGAAFSSTMWYPNVQEWSKHFRIIAVDIIGDLNQSQGERPLVQKNDYSKWLIEVLDQLQIDQAHVLGLSYGGYVAMATALHVSNRLKKLVLVSPAVALAPLSLTFLWKAFGMVFRKHGVDHFMAWMFEKRYSLHPDFMNQVRAGFAWAKVKPKKQRSKQPSFSDAELASLKVPTLLLLGEQEVVFNAHKAYQRAIRHMPCVEAHLLPNVGHVPTMEDADKINKQISQFLLSE